MRERIEFVEYAPVSSWVPRADRYEYAPKRGWAWAQRLCILFLRWRGCFSRDEVISYTRHVIDSEDLLDRILKQDHSLLDLYHRKGERLLVGAETMAELMGHERIRSGMSFDATYGYGRQLFGMKITVVPWMSGLLVLPKEIEA